MPLDGDMRRVGLFVSSVTVSTLVSWVANHLLQRDHRSGLEERLASLEQKLLEVSQALRDSSVKELLQKQNEFLLEAADPSATALQSGYARFQQKHFEKIEAELKRLHGLLDAKASGTNHQ
jgi:hypothetical protein